MLIIASIPKEERVASNPVIVTSAIVVSVHRYGSYIRVPILTVSTFVAFAPYRRVLLKQIFKNKNTCCSGRLPQFPLKRIVIAVLLGLARLNFSSDVKMILRSQNTILLVLLSFLSTSLRKPPVPIVFCCKCHVSAMGFGFHCVLTQVMAAASMAPLSLTTTETTVGATGKHALLWQLNRLSLGAFPSNPYLQISISWFNLANVAFIMFVSLNVDRNDMSRLFTVWLYSTQVPNDVIQVGISVLQMIGLVDSSGNAYRDTPDYVQLVGKYFTDLANNAYRILAVQMLMATSMSYLLPFTFAKVFHPK
ncbi:hypothetical protein L596_013436 [Steinernema carpocapsae]|uniref:Uncharacterized protein n=1 Tax=Steinernema carpocapsae TaxID=34508 RepID=A0A4U5P0M5_STECR|nr:hypothetical protein L596_013436 [Steinernema carpocapsae]